MTVAEEIDLKKVFLSGIVPSTVIPNNIRDKALAAIDGLSFPSHKDEYWKYSRPTKIVNSTFTSQPDNEVVDFTSFKIPDLDAYRLIIVNGYFRADLSDNINEAGLTVTPFGDPSLASNEVFNKYLGKVAREEKPNVFTEINTAYATGGLFITAAKKTIVSKPIHIIHIKTLNDCITNPRHLFVAQPQSDIKIICSYKSSTLGRTFTNAVTEIVVEQNARLDYNKIQFEHEESLSITLDAVHQERDSYYNGNTITLNGGWIRNNLNIALDGENCESRLFGLFPVAGHQHVDNHTLVDHRKPNCLSNELYKGIADGNAVGVFNGKVFVRQDAQKTNAFQQNNNIILSDTAGIFAKPELEIYADDVKCSHGCTIGQFDDEALFYLRSRGISIEKARNLMVYAFAEEVLENITIEPLKLMVEELMANRFKW